MPANIPSKPGQFPGIAKGAAVTRNTMTAPATGVLILERLPAVKARTGLSRSEIYRRVQTGGFPAPIKLGERASAWSASEVDSWIAARIAERDGKGTA